MRIWIGVIALALFGTLAACSLTGGDDYESPRYSVIKKHDAIELRNYEPMLLAEVSINEADRDDAGNAAFRILFDYISGANSPEQDIAMTVPVTQTAAEGQKIAMTTPVTQTAQQTGVWRTNFRLPSSFTLASAPKPTDDRIRLYESTPEKILAITFSGFWSDSNMMQHKALLDAYVEENGLRVIGPERYAFYNSPFTLPWMRRNEVLYPVQ